MKNTISAGSEVQRGPIATRKYRAYYTPLDQFRTPLASESGVLPFVQLHASNAEAAQRAAHAVTGCPIDRVERLEEVPL